MAILTQEMKDLITSQQCFYATVSKEGMPNVALKRSTVIDNETLLFTEGYGGATYQNILDGSKVAIAAVDMGTVNSYRFIGTPEVHTSGEYFDEVAAVSQQNNRPTPVAVIIIHIDEVYNLKPGPEAGKKIV